MIRRAGVWAFLLFVGAAGPVRAGIHDRLMWTDSAVAAPDRHVAFRGTFSLDADTTVDLQLSGASWYVVWLDGAYYTEGPDRYAAKYPEYQTRRVRLAARRAYAGRAGAARGRGDPHPARDSAVFVRARFGRRP